MKPSTHTPTPKATACDVLVIGGGPAGSTAAASLSALGWDVVLLEKDQYPRFHIGESLLPRTLPILEKLGVLEQIHQSSIIKYGGEFNSPTTHKNPVTYNFSKAHTPPFPYAYEVKRADFDTILLENCAAKGTQVHQNMRVESVLLPEDTGSETTSVQARDEKGQTYQWCTRFLVDASGRNTFLANRSHNKIRNPNHRSAAIYAHVSGAEFRPDKRAGNISVYWFDHGWCWLIPFKDGTMSVGAVCWPDYLKTRSTGLDEFLWQTLHSCPGLPERLKNAHFISPATATGNYTYQCKKLYGKGYLVIGDAYAFLDPILSSGVHMAMSCGLFGSEAIHIYLNSSRPSLSCFRQYNKQVHRGIREFSWFIYRITQPALRKMFMGPSTNFGMEKAIVSLLSGDVYNTQVPRLPILIFKLVYYFLYCLEWGTNRAASRRRKQAILRGPLETVTPP